MNYKKFRTYAAMGILLTIVITSALFLKNESGSEADFEYSIYEDTAVIERYIGAKVSVVIPSEIEGKAVRAIGENAFEKCDRLKHITIPDSVVEIGDAAFYGCSSLTQIVLPESLEEIGREAFGGCRRLTDVVIPSGVEELEMFAFEGCKRLESVKVPEQTIIDDKAFQNCPRIVITRY